MKKITICLLFFFLAGLPLSSVLAAEKQDTSNVNFADSRVKPLFLESLTVTAEKQEQDLQKVPVSVTALTGVEIEDRRIRSISDVADFTPNFIIPSTGIVGLYVPAIRGIHQESSGSSPIGLFVDGVPILSATGFNDEPPAGQ